MTRVPVVNLTACLVTGTPLISICMGFLIQRCTQCEPLRWISDIYSGAVLITFIFVVMTFDQSDILCIPSYKFIPLLVLYIEGFIP